MNAPFDLNLQDVLNAYANGMFPMADSADDKTYWVDPPLRGQLSIHNLHVPKRLKAKLKTYPYIVTHDTAFEQVITMCAQSSKGRETTWINEEIKDIFIRLYYAGFAHSVECWRKPEQSSDENTHIDTDTDTEAGEQDIDTSELELVGGTYGLAIGGLFCAESKFHRATDASKIALVHLAARLWKAGFTILDTQFTNPHLEQFGIYEIPKKKYLKSVKNVIIHKTNFDLKTYTEQQLIGEYLTYLDQKQVNNT